MPPRFRACRTRSATRRVQAPCLGKKPLAGPLAHAERRRYLGTGQDLAAVPGPGVHSGGFGDPPLVDGGAGTRLAGAAVLAAQGAADAAALPGPREGLHRVAPLQVVAVHGRVGCRA